MKNLKLMVLAVASFAMPADMTMIVALSNLGTAGTILAATNHWLLFLGAATTLYQFPAMNCTVPAGWNIITYHLKDGVETFYVNGVGLVSRAETGRTADTAKLEIGSNTSDGYAFDGHIGEMVICSAPTFAQRVAAEQYLADKWDIAWGPQPGDPIRVLVDGDSISAPTGNDWPSKLALGGDYAVSNYAVSSQCITYQGGSPVAMETDYPYQIGPFADGGRNILIMWEYVNEAGVTTDGDSLYAAIRGYYLQAKADGFIVIACTDFHTGAASGAAGTKCHDASELVRANWMDFADALVDLDRSDLRADSATLDNTHLTSDGEDIVAGLMNTAILALA